MLEYFPDLAGRRITHAWGGPIDASPTHLPAITSLPRSRAWVAAGYTGNGVGPTNMVGLSLASLALDRSDDPTRLAFVDAEMPRVPPEPFHWIGGESIRLGIAKKEDAEHERPPPEPHRLSRRQGPAAARLPHRPVAAARPRGEAWGAPPNEPPRCRDADGDRPASLAARPR